VKASSAKTDVKYRVPKGDKSGELWEVSISSPCIMSKEEFERDFFIDVPLSKQFNMQKKIQDPNVRFEVDEQAKRSYSKQGE